MHLRPAIISDQTALFDMHEKLFRDHIEEIWGWDDEWQLANFQKEWDEVITEVIHIEDAILGYIQIRMEPDHIYVLNLALDTQYQSQGLGSKAMNILKKRAMNQRLPLRLSVFKTNQRVITFYERLGFRVDEETDTGCRMCWSVHPNPLPCSESKF